MLANGGTLLGKRLLNPESQEITAVLMVQQGSERVLHDFEHIILAAIAD